MPWSYGGIWQARGRLRAHHRKALLELPKVGFLTSRGQLELHGNLPLKPGEAIISGFLSPMERAVLRAGLAHKRPMIWVLPRGLDALHADTACRVAIEEGRLLILSPFAATLESPNARRAAWCNQYVLAHCDRAVVGHLSMALTEMDPPVLNRMDPSVELM